MHLQDVVIEADDVKVAAITLQKWPNTLVKKFVDLDELGTIGFRQMRIVT